MEIVLVHPEIAPNTGAIIRLARTRVQASIWSNPWDSNSTTGSTPGRTRLPRARHGTVHPDLAALDAARPGPWWGFSAHGSTRFTDAPIDAEDVLVFGAERAGLTDAARARIGNDQLLSIPMVEGSRSLTLANAVAVVVYDTWRRLGYPGSAGGGSVAEAPRQQPF